MITNRGPPEVLQQYTTVMLLGDVEMTPDVVQRLRDFVRSGGDLLLDAGHAKSLPELVHWMTDPLQYRVPEIEHLKPTHQLLQGVRAVLAAYFASFSPVAVEPSGLGITICCYADDPKRLLVGLMNHDLFADWQGTLRMRLGPMTAVREIWKDQALPPQNPLPLAIPAGEAVILNIRLECVVKNEHWGSRSRQT